MKFSVILDSIQSKVVPSEDSGMTFKQAVEEILDYCREAGYTLQEEFFQVVSENQEQYLAGKFPISLA